MPQKQQKNDKVIRVGGARNQHQTRIARRVTCARCGQEDYISLRPGHDKTLLCRACAAKVLNAYEVGAHVPAKVVHKKCTNCGIEFELNGEVQTPDDELVCFDCLKGFEVWQGSRTQKPEERAQHTLQKRTSGVMLRKKSK